MLLPDRPKALLMQPPGLLRILYLFSAMPQDLRFLPFFLTEDLIILPEDRPAPAPARTAVAAKPQAETQAAPKATGTVKAVPPIPAVKTPSTAPTAKAAEAVPQEKQENKPAPNPHLIFGKNLKKLLILVEDHNHPVMERADGLLLKDILKAVNYSFDDVAIVNIAHCREEVDWQTVNEIPYQRLFSFGIRHPKLPATLALAPYELETSGERKFLFTDKLELLRSDRSRKIALWNLLKQVFV